MSIPTEKKQAVEKLLEYLPFFEITDREDICRWVTEEKSPDGTMPVTYPMYRDELIDFINLVYENDLMDTSYMQTMEKLSGGEVELEAIIYGIDRYDFDMVMALLTFIIRQERFCYGLWAMAARDKWFTTILNRLKDLDED